MNTTNKGIEEWEVRAAEIALKAHKKARQYAEFSDIIYQGIKNVVSRQREDFEEKIYNFPWWVTEEMRVNFFGMWRAFGRTPRDYYEDIATQMNGKECAARHLTIDEEIIIGVYFHKWNNIGWIFDGEKVHHVYGAISKKPYK